MERLLLDTHALIWASYAPARLGPAARRALEDSANDIFVSAVSAFEIANKYRLGKLGEARSLAQQFIGSIVDRGFRELPLNAAHAQRGGALAIDHRDPFDRMLIAQAQIEQLTLVSNEKRFDTFGVIRLW
ncbi:MAG: type II toxin-antitoxin system VapC family toxin [Sphingomonadaceae bacterium]|nr:type II toxin-antitoxin system VapC family toxin [Sphingomonadaceae bacterium]